ncbi:class I SAM-dependent methyltransferase [Salicola sp. Rm-C-2C1-2]|uniref:class I SAM-dependent methyltransferase n=1 Tax=Salicola sp. Rm-C-2C1-2 TaxID=3141321 RepID=UPI0032E42ADA
MFRETVPVSLAAVYERYVFSPVLKLAERRLADVRKELLSQASGQVLEIGIGTGLSLSYYGPHVERIAGLEPSEVLLAECRERVARRHDGPPVELMQAGAEAMPFGANRFDTVVAFLVFCTIPEADRAALEMARVLKPGGRLLFFEHVSAGEPGLARWQQRLNPLWRSLACGCNINRDTRRVFEGAGFDMGGVEVWRHPDIPLPLVQPVIEGNTGLRSAVSELRC